MDERMGNGSQIKTPVGEPRVRALLAKHECPVPYHEVRTRFLGNIVTPQLAASPMQIVKDLWGGELPIFDSMDEVNELLDILINGMWNELTRHQKRSQPFKLTRISLEPSAENLEQFGRVRQQELDGFVEGLFAGQAEMDLPERAHVALEKLGELRAMIAGISDLVARNPEPQDPTELATTFKGLRELNRIMETEINEAVLSCTRARRQMLAGIPTDRPTFH
jgi:hypothetical protein